MTTHAAGRTTGEQPLPGLSRPALVAETVIVVMIAVGLASLRSLWSLLRSLTAPESLSSQAAVLNGTRAPGRPWIDLGFQVLAIVGLLLPAALAIALAVRDGGRLEDIGIRFDRLGRQILTGLGIGAIIGGIGLLLYLLSRWAGTSLNVVLTTLPDVWWRIPILVSFACANAILEEVVFCGYLLRRLDQLGFSARRSVVVAALIRGGYHLYQGLAGALGNLAMGLVFGTYAKRTGRIIPLVVAHAAIDIVAYVGYVMLAGKVSWLPLP